MGLETKKAIKFLISTALFFIGMSAGWAQRPNIVFILADDLGYGDLGYLGQQSIQTSHIERLAKEGTVFTDFYAGAPVCSPSRSVLLTGLHTGHTTIRGNATITGGTPGKKGSQTVYRANLSNTDFTVGHLLQQSGYRTALVGKWHLDGYDRQATPLQRGFDEFSGWLISYPETYASTYWPEKRYRNGQLIDISENRNDNKGYYSTDLTTDEALDFLSRQQDSEQPFFLFVSYDSPHSPLDAPDLAIYEGKDWTEDAKTYASMVHHLDASIGRLHDYLVKSGLSENTVVFFCSDNGPRSEPSAQLTAVADFFDSNGPLKGYKRDLYEGGIRSLLIVWGSSHVKSGAVHSSPGYFADILPTFAGIAGSNVAFVTDGQNLYPAIQGKEASKEPRFLYWEFFENGFEQAIRYGKWKAIKRKDVYELYDLSVDKSETNNIAAQNPDIIKIIADYLKTARTDSPFWPVSN